MSIKEIQQEHQQPIGPNWNQLFSFHHNKNLSSAYIVKSGEWYY